MHQTVKLELVKQLWEEEIVNPTVAAKDQLHEELEKQLTLE